MAPRIYRGAIFLFRLIHHIQVTGPEDRVARTQLANQQLISGFHFFVHREYLSAFVLGIQLITVQVNVEDIYDDSFVKEVGLYEEK